MEEHPFARAVGLTRLRPPFSYDDSKYSLYNFDVFSENILADYLQFSKQKQTKDVVDELLHII